MESEVRSQNSEDGTPKPRSKMVTHALFLNSSLLLPRADGCLLTADRRHLHGSR